MTEKKYNLPLTTIDKFYRNYVEIIKPFLNGVTNKEADVLAELMFQHYLKKDIPSLEDRFKLILESSNRRSIENKLNLTSASFRNILSSLKTRKLLDDNNHLKQIFLIVPEKNTLTLSFTFNIDNGE